MIETKVITVPAATMGRKVNKLNRQGWRVVSTASAERIGRGAMVVTLERVSDRVPLPGIGSPELKGFIAEAKAVRKENNHQRLGSWWSAAEKAKRAEKNAQRKADRVARIMAKRSAR